MAHEVFISHSAKNREVADAICVALEQSGIRCWVAPRDVRPGRSFPGEITRAIQSSKVMLLVFSSHSNNSEQVLREVQLATESRLALVRFRIEDVSMNDDLKYFLSTPHWIDAITPPLSGHIARLQVAIKELVGQSVEVVGKDVAASPSNPETPASTPLVPANPPATFPSAPAVPPPPIPKKSISEKAPASPVSSKPIAAADLNPPKKSSARWILLAIAAVVIVTGILGAVCLILMQPEPSSKQSSTASTKAQPSDARPTPVSSPAQRVTKVKEKPAAQPIRTPKAAPTANTAGSDKAKNRSAFERAGALQGDDDSASEEEEESTNPFDRAGRGIDPDDSTAEPSPDDR